MQAIVTVCIILLLVTYSMYKRLRPRPVQPTPIITTSAIIVALSLLSLFSTSTFFTHPLALVLALPALILGLVGGFLLMRSTRFWIDKTTGVLWMKGGVLYLAVWLVTLLLRQGAAYANGGYTGGRVPFSMSPTLTALATDLVIISMGMWIARAIALVLKYREYKHDQRVQQSL